ncbi:MAG: polysaccharide deacetylase family protein [Saprospiraceae bacterium]|nr:polysaccharide deacetylase family protein [Saprospiraceae bacterium]
MYLTRTPNFIQNLFPNFTWRVPTEQKVAYLTFDDGPIPEITPWVLDQLDAYQAKATFFCVGENVTKHPDIFEMVVQRGHQVGNHTYNHLSGWSTDNMDYYHNVRKCAQLVKSSLFRPPYGRLKPHQVQFLQRHYQIVMWDVLSGDFDPGTTLEQCYDNVMSKVRNGSIIVFHDSIKAEEKLKYTLPLVLEELSTRGFTFESIVAEHVEPVDTLRKIA